MKSTKDVHGATPLHYAQSEKTALSLITKGTDINAMDENGITPVSRAVWRDNIDVVKLLISKGADINLKNKYSYSPLHSVKSKEVARLLIENGADVNATDSDGNTPLHEVFMPEKDWTARIKIGANVSYCDTNLKELVEYLIEQGADVKVKNKRGETPSKKFLKYAKDWGLREETTKEIENVFRKHGAKE
jgi:ankyrin repeat protein